MNQETTSNVALFKPEVLYESLRNGDFDFLSGLGEIVDNSIEAGAQEINIDIETQEKDYGGRKKNVITQIIITDDGKGMPIDILQRCLALGESIRRSTAIHIGRFGVGLTLGGISFARRIEVYTRTSPDEHFYTSHIDLDEIKRKDMTDFPTPRTADPPEKAARQLVNEHGTVVVLADCDRLQYDPVKERGIDADTWIEKLPYWLGRTYRKFIQAGRRIILHNNEKTSRVYLHDPLYIMGPTVFEGGTTTEPKADLVFNEKIHMSVPNGKKGEKAAITVKISLLPEVWRMNRGDGNNEFAKKHKITENEGISILRENREVLYAKVPFLIGTRGQAKYQEIDRWWGCEISFPPSLDEYFQVKHIKRGAEPIESLRDTIRVLISDKVKELRRDIKQHYVRVEAQKKQDFGIFSSAENKMAVSTILPGKTKMLPDQELDRIVAELCPGESCDRPDVIKRTREALIQEILHKPFTVKPVSFPQHILFEPEYIGENVLVKLNTNHPFYQKIMKPLYEGEDGLESSKNENANEKYLDAILLMLISYCKAEAQDPSQTAYESRLRERWGQTLATVMDELI